MKLKVNFLKVIGITLIFVVFSGCSINKINDISKVNDNKDIKIGFSLATLMEERWLRDRDIFVSKIKQMGADVIVQVANNDSSLQYDQAKEMIDEGISVLVIAPEDYEKAADIVAMAKSKGVKVICYDRLIKKANADLYVSFDNVKIGELMTKAMIKAAPSGNYIIINGAPTDNNCYMYNKGFRNILRPYINKRIINVRSEIWANAWSPDEATTFVENALSGGYKLNGIIAANDNLAGAAIDVLSEQRLAGKVKVVGHDADLAGCQRVAEGTQIATIYKSIEKMADAAAKASIKLAKGKRIKVKEHIYDGKYTIPNIVIAPILVTKDNIQETVIKDGFHSFEDVYRNVPINERPKDSGSNT